MGDLEHAREGSFWEYKWVHWARRASIVVGGERDILGGGSKCDGRKRGKRWGDFKFADLLDFAARVWIGRH